MSDTTTSGTTPAAPSLSLFAKLQAWMAAELTTVEQTAMHLLGVAATETASIHDDIQASPMAQEAIALAESHGIPVGEIGADVSAVIAEGQKLAAQLAQAPAVPVAPAAPPPAAA